MLHFVLEKVFGYGNLQIHSWNAVKLWDFAIWFQKMSLCATKSRGLRAEYCIVGIPHNTDI